MQIQFRQVRDGMTGQINPSLIEYFDAYGNMITVPSGHRIWIETYIPWLAAGNTPLGPDDPWPTP